MRPQDVGRRATDRPGAIHPEGGGSGGDTRLPACDKHMLNTLRSRIAALAPQEVADSMETVTLSRFSFRSFIAIALLVVAVYVVFTQIQPAEMIKAVKEANIAMALVCVLFGLLAWFGSAMTLGCFMDADKRNPIGLYCSQMASGFTAVSMPAGVGRPLSTCSSCARAATAIPRPPPS